MRNNDYVLDLDGKRYPPRSYVVEETEADYAKMDYDDLRAIYDGNKSPYCDVVLFLMEGENVTRVEIEPPYVFMFDKAGNPMMVVKSK